MTQQADSTSDNSNRRKFKNHLLGSPRQLNYSVGFLLIGVAFLAGYIFVFTYFMRGALAPLSSAYVITPEVLYSIRHSVQMAIYVAIVFAILITVTIFVVGTAVSQRTFGPFVQIVRMLDEIKAGNYSKRIQLRKNDEFHDIANLLNEIAVQLQNSQSKK